ncbi:ERAP1-like C-terminal domain [Popillia japonica]|uniref:ERAP1-like C-terminal domain n=1 Tax=Popillia japonica TaxID=7064 RepID=A0AAW1LB16_POPJA
MILKLVLVLVTTLGVTLSKFPDVPYSDVRNISPINDGSYRIPNDTIPISYDILLEPNFETFTFDGEVIITIEVVEDTSTITLHANDLQIGTEDVEVDARNNEISPVVEDTEFVEDFHFFKIHLAEEVGAGEILEISIKYTGNLNTANRGFYRARYVENEIEKWFATTQFESTDARRAFPCYDEPALKATFTIRIIRPASYNSVSNMPLLEINDLGDGRFEDVFEESVLMSTYLVAFVVSEMAKTVVVENQAVIGVPFYINDGRGEFAQTTGIETVKAMEEFTGVQYTLDKLDQVAIPDNYFSAGAMENWGLVTYRESYLLYKDGISTSSEKQRIAAIISHEYGHQWFGNLVSPLWWTYIWLNEGFATYFEHYATDEVDPELRMMDQYVLLVNQYAMDNDALVSTRRMSYYAETPSDISRLFDRIAYEKSGSVIRMMEHFLTTATFRRGLNIYLNARGLKAAQASDLWEAMQQAISEESSTILGDLNIVDIMETWNMNTGFPVITVSRNEDGKVVLSQTRFFLDREAVDEDNPVWTVPINYYNADPENDFTDTRANYWLTAAEDTTDIDLADDEWFILNKQGIGYYRTDYSDELWSLNIDTLILLTTNGLY